MNRFGGVYLVIDPKRDRATLLRQLGQALEGGLDIVQVWNHWAEGITHVKKLDFLSEVKTTCRSYRVPVLLHEDWELAIAADVHGVHFDEIPQNFPAVRAALGGKVIGTTVGNDLERIKWAEEQGIDYISFCAVFPSSSVSRCEIVKPENIRAARSITDRSIFLSGGIQPGNLGRLRGLDFDGVAIISGILDAPDPAEAVKAYRLALHNLRP